MSGKNGDMLVGCAVVFKERGGKIQFLLNKNDQEEWELLKSIARKGESSVRSVIRYTTEQGHMNAKVLEEVSRSSVPTVINGRSVNQKFLYYVMFYKVGGEMIGFSDVAWFDYSSSIKKLKNKKDIDALKKANLYIKVWKKDKKTRNVS